MSVGPIFVTIIQEAVTRGFSSSFRVILGSASADAILMIPALAASWIIAKVTALSFYVSLIGTAFFIYLSFEAIKDARRLWNSKNVARSMSDWSFWKGVFANLVNPLTWTFWLVTGTPTMLRVYKTAGWAGLLIFTVVWFVTASGLEALIAYAASRTKRNIGARGQAILTGISAFMFLFLAGILLKNLT